MKSILTLSTFFLVFNLNAQIKGNKTIVKSEISIESFESLYIGLYADYDVDMSREAFLEISIDENLLQYVEKSVKDGELRIDQKEWIQASGPVKITIGAKGMNALSQSAHSRTFLRNINQKEISVNADVGDIFLEGGVNELNIKVSTATVDASKLSAETGEFEFESWGKIIANVKGDYSSENNEDGILLINGESEAENNSNDEEVRFIKFVIKNNSANRHQFYVVGPKPDGSRFSYGFPMMPYQKRDKDWTNGTKVYKVNNLGLRKLVKTIKLSDEGEIVNIFE